MLITVSRIGDQHGPEYARQSPARTAGAIPDSKNQLVIVKVECCETHLGLIPRCRKIEQLGIDPFYFDEYGRHHYIATASQAYRLKVFDPAEHCFVASGTMVPRYGNKKAP
jgi:hypothetical protein